MSSIMPQKHAKKHESCLRCSSSIGMNSIWVKPCHVHNSQVTAETTTGLGRKLLRTNNVNNLLYCPSELRQTRGHLLQLRLLWHGRRGRSRQTTPLGRQPLQPWSAQAAQSAQPSVYATVPAAACDAAQEHLHDYPIVSPRLVTSLRSVNSVSGKMK